MTVGPTEREALWQRPRLDDERRVLTGTAAGVAREIGIDPVYVRVAFVVLAVAGGWGVLLYAAAWLLLRAADPAGYVPRPKARTSEERVVGFVLVALGMVALASQLNDWFLHALVWPAALVGGAVALAFDRGAIDRTGLTDIARLPNMGGRVVLGLSCLFAGVMTALLLSLSFWQAVSGIAVAALVLAGTGIVFAPMLARLGADLLAERRRRIRSEERADMAAHLHDSVLQTLALIQKRSPDAGVVNLARRQERELRAWLFDDRSLNPNLGFRASLEDAAAEVEDLHHIPIDVVVVGDCPTDGDVTSLLLAAREAMANAARHSGASRVDVFGEVGTSEIEIFVRDQGRGFDPAVVDADRAGIRDSITGRMERHGGRAEITSSPGRGTEVELRLPRLPMAVARPASS